MGRTGVLVMAFGGPSSLDEVGAFCTHLMGREPSAEVLERVTRRYLVIGGKSPLPETALAIARSLETELASRAADDAEPVRVALGMLHSRPFISDAVDALAAEGIDRVVMVSLSPLESAHSSGAYRDAAIRAAAVHEMTLVEAPSFRTTAPYLDSLTDGMTVALEEAEGDRKGVLFTAHSLPAEEIGGDPYVDQLRDTAAGLAYRLGLPPAALGGKQNWLPRLEAYGSDADRGTPWLLCYQSKGQRPGKWLGPDVLEVVDAMAKARFDAVVFAPIGFATDHMETLYDLDVEASGLALDLGMDFRRSAVPNDNEYMIEALAEVVAPLL